MGQKSAQPLVSVIIACKNTAEHFRECLLSVENQTYKNIEIIVVDNFSTDGTYQIAQKYADQTYQKGPERSTQFNFGFSKSKGDYIYRIGPDYRLEPDVIEKCVKKMQEGYDALALHNRSVGDSIWAKVRFFERESYRNDKTIVAARFMKRSVFESLGMFDESLVAGEDFDLHNRLEAAGYKWSHVDAIEDHIGEPKNVRDVWRKFYYYGRTIQRYREKNKSVAGKQLVFFRPSFIKVQKDLLKQPALFFYFWIYMVVKHIAGLCGILAGPPRDLPTNSKPVKSRSATCKVSVIVPTKNSEKSMNLFLNSFLDNTYLNYEIIVNDDVTSTDKLELLVQKYVTTYQMPVKYYRENISMAQGRSSGVLHSDGDFVLHLDSDMQVTPNLLSECVDAIKSNKNAAIVIPEKSIGSSFWAKVKALEKSMYEGISQMESARFMSRRIYDIIGGHDNSLVFSEDKDLDIRLRQNDISIISTTNFLIHNEGSIRLFNTLKKKLNYSATSTLFATKHPKQFRWQANIVNRYIIYLKNWRTLYIHPILYLCLFILKFLEYLFSFYGIVRRKLIGFASSRSLLFDSGRLCRKKEKETRVLIITHSTLLHGPIDTFEEFLVKKDYPVYKMIHPLLDYKKIGTSLSLNCVKLFKKERRSLGTVNLLSDFLISIKTVLKLKPEVYMGANNFDTLPGIIAKKIFRLKIQRIIFFGTDFSEERYKSRLMNSIYYFVERVAIKYSDTVISNTIRAESKRKSYGLADSKSLVIPNGVKLENPIFKNKVIDYRQFIFVGSVTKEHGLFEIIEKIHNEIKKLVIIGSGDDLERVVDLCKDLGIKLELHINLTHSETIKYLQEFKGVGLAPYNNSSMWTYYCSPLKIVEYVSCGIPVLMSSMPEISGEVIESKLGIVYDDTTKRETIINKLKNEDFSNFAIRSRQFYEKYSVDNLLNKVIV